MPLPAENFQSWLSHEDLNQISQTLREPETEELVARQMFPANTEFGPWINQLGYDAVLREGKAVVVAAGGKAGDVPRVGEQKKRHWQGAVEIMSGYDWTFAEEETAKEARKLGRGPSIDFITRRAADARRFINEQFNRIFMTGLSEANIKGLLDSSFYATSRAAADTEAHKDKGVLEDTAASGTGASDDLQRLWANKTPGQKFEDLRVGAAHVNRMGKFKADTLALTPDAYWEMAKPYSDQNPMSLLSVINDTLGEFGFFKRLLVSRAFRRGAAADGFNGDTVDYFAVYDSRATVAEHCLLLDMYEHPMFIDRHQNKSVDVVTRAAGALVYQPPGIYWGKGIAKDA